MVMVVHNSDDAGNGRIAVMLQVVLVTMMMIIVMMIQK
jgi:hypothetical protein